MPTASLRALGGRWKHQPDKVARVVRLSSIAYRPGRPPCLADAPTGFPKRSSPRRRLGGLCQGRRMVALGTMLLDWFRMVRLVSNAGMGVKPLGQVPHVGNAGMGVQAIGKVPHVGNAGRGQDRLLTSQGRAAWVALHELADRLGRVRVIHGCWDRCLNHHYGAVRHCRLFFDPPYKAYEALCGVATPVAADVEKWCAENAHLSHRALRTTSATMTFPGWDVKRRGRAAV